MKDIAGFVPSCLFSFVSSVLLSCLVLCLVVLFCQFTLLSVCQFARYLASHPVCLSVCPYACLPVCSMSARLSVRLSVCLPACLQYVCMPVCLSACLPGCSMSACLSVHLSGQVLLKKKTQKRLVSAPFPTLLPSSGMHYRKQSRKQTPWRRPQTSEIHLFCE